MGLGMWRHGGGEELDGDILTPPRVGPKWASLGRQIFSFSFFV
jgi:hypothetical protein